MEVHSIGVRLRMLNNAVRRFIDRTSENKKEIDNLTCSNGWIIGHLCEAERQGQDVFQRDLENEFGITRSTASKVLILLEKKGLICRVGVSHDARLKKITLTDRSREIGSRMSEDAYRMEKVLTKGFSTEELETLYSYLERLQKNIDSAEEKELCAKKGADKTKC